MMEIDIIQLISSNAVGVLFGLLMYRMANTTIKDNTAAIREMITIIKNRKR